MGVPWNVPLDLAWFWWVCREVEDRERYWGREGGRRRYCDFSEVLAGVSWNFWGGADIPPPGGVSAEARTLFCWC